MCVDVDVDVCLLCSARVFGCAAAALSLSWDGMGWDAQFCCLQPILIYYFYYLDFDFLPVSVPFGFRYAFRSFLTEKPRPPAIFPPDLLCFCICIFSFSVLNSKFSNKTQKIFFWWEEGHEVDK